MKTICIFCSINEVENKYVVDASALAQLMGENGYDLVWGGANKGLMKVVADGVQNAGGKLIGVTSTLLQHKKRTNADEMIIVENISQTKAELRKRSDAVILLAGGTGSLDEICEVIELKKHNLHAKPIVILNTDNFYAGLKTQLERMEREGFLQKKLEEFLFFAKNPKEAIDYIKRSLANEEITV